MRLPLISFCLCLLLVGCNYVRNVILLTGGSAPKGDFLTTIPFEYRKGLIIVKAKLNGQEEAEFIFDTGAFNSKVGASLADRLELPVKAQKKNSDTHGTERKIEVLRIDELQVGSLKFQNIGAGSLAYDSLSASPCIASGGIIGGNLIKLANWKIDYEKRLIHISSKPFAGESKNDIRLPFRRPALSLKPSVRLTLNGKEADNIIIDTGRNSDLRLPKSIMKALGASSELSVADRSISGIYGLRADTLHFSSLSAEEFDANIPVTFSGNGAGLLGNEILENYRLILNRKPREIVLCRTESENPASFESERLRIIPGVLNDSLWVLNRVPVGKKLQLGDTLRSVNGRKPAELFSGGYCDYFIKLRKVFCDESLKTGNLKIETQDGNLLEIRFKDKSINN